MTTRMNYLIVRREKEILVINMDEIAWISLTPDGEGASLYHSEEKRAAITLVGEAQVQQLLEFVRRQSDDATKAALEQAIGRG